MSFRWQAVLLLGPTGSGKTPLGELLEKRGFWDMKCLHFDFGQQLRSSVVRQRTPLNREEIAIVRGVLRDNALLGDEHFSIALKLFRDYLSLHQAGRSEIIMLNGLPRHEGQAEAMNGSVDIEAVLELKAAPDVVRERIRKNSGRDRRHRTDDTIQEVQRKLRLYELRTQPLVEHYRSRGVRILSYDVTVETTAVEIRSWLETQKPAKKPYAQEE